MAHIKGLRFIKAKGTYYACHAWRDEDNRQHQLKESLRTSNELTAAQRLPAALTRLQRKAQGLPIPQPLRPDTEGLTWDEEGNEVMVTAAEVMDADAFEITWQQALAIHMQRREEKQGRPLSSSTVQILKHSIRGLQQAPGAMTPQDVRRHISSLKGKGLSPLTVRKQCSMLSAVVTTLERMAYLPDEYTNPFKKVDFSATSRNHRHTATPEECKAIMSLDYPELRLQLFCGWRTDEIAHLTYEDGWAELQETSTYRPKNDYSLRRLPLPEGLAPIQNARGRGTLNTKIKEVAPACTSYSLRHAWRTAAREAQIPTDLAEHCFGHALPTMQATYGTFSDAAVRGAMEKVWAVIESWLHS